MAGGDSLLAPQVTRAVIKQIADHAEPDTRLARRVQRLTPRERDVFVLIARGLSNVEMARALVVEESTVKTHVKRILAKLEVRDRVHAVILAYESGLMALSLRNSR